MKSFQHIEHVLPEEPYASYESPCTISKSSTHPTKLYFIHGQPFKRCVAPADYNIFYLNLSARQPITGRLSRPDSDQPFEALPGQLVTIVPARSELTLQVNCNYQQAVLCIHQTVLDEKASEVSRGQFNRAKTVFSTPADSPLLCAAMREIEQAQTGQPGFDSVYLKSLYDVVMAKVINRYTTLNKALPSFKMHSPIHVKKVLEYIFDNLDKDIAVATLAAKMGLSTFHFTRIFKEYTGLSPYQYILDVRFERSKELLSQTDMTLVAIANALGFSSQSHFQSFFKKQAGITPKAFRSQKISGS